MATAADRSELLALTVEVVAAHVSNNKIEAGDLPALIRQVYATLAGIDGTAAATLQAPMPGAASRRLNSPPPGMPRPCCSRSARRRDSTWCRRA